MTRHWHSTRARIVRWRKPADDSFAAAAAVYGPDVMLQLQATMPRKMTPDEIRAFLNRGTRTAKVATSGPGGQPHVMPVWFALDGEELVFTTWGDSVKGRDLRRNPRAAIVVDEQVAPYAFVHMRGYVTLSEDLEELLRRSAAATWAPTEPRSSAAETPCRASCWCGSVQNV